MNRLSYLFLGMLFIVSACGMKTGQGINLFSIDQDKEFGAQVAAEIDNDRVNYPLLDSVKYADIYQYIYGVRDKILNSGKVQHKNDFGWRIRVIKNDTTLNAFCTPGGYIYVYTGILKYLDSEDQFAGVLGHEIAHADMRHSTQQMTQMYGVESLARIVLGKYENIAAVTSSLVGLKFSRNHEAEADKKSVEYLCPTDYNAGAGGRFFEKIESAGGASVPEFLSTHPDPGNRIESYKKYKEMFGCTGENSYASEYKRIMNKLPK